ncbi:SGNH hydrolase-like domain-containing protein, acetyltransferase AlgX [Hathewaya proteolytica DSM 3090]|uniref:SGNH hydrolase-like domain-containing protein, acetyltransferase AlgX n=1 Tax=Hathewaya proteolytica DSM 3090 TaxID=1121331 RepID=A0A1M6PJ16_9CLOT|nr:DHHW family protein [Hathewaya proteolytica]SHK07931.1 SGNH hydrolase-like domain-containing protein, acetyltransferase AlgX [Hathewaya proteolytica DSM 3090]
MDNILKNKYFKFIMYIALTIVYFAITVFLYLSLVDKNIKVNMDVGYDGDTYFVAFFTNKAQPIYNDDMCARTNILEGMESRHIHFDLNTQDVKRIKILFGHKERRIKLKSVEVKGPFKNVTMAPQKIKDIFYEVSDDIESVKVKDNYLEIICSGKTPYISAEKMGQVMDDAPYNLSIILSLAFVAVVLSFGTYLIQGYFNKKKVLCRNVVFISLFMLTLCSSNLVLIAGIKNIKSTENRGSSTAVDPSIRGMERIIRTAESNYNDYFGLRNNLISASSKLENDVFHDAATDKVILGKEGWLFYKKDDVKDLSEDYRGILKFTQDELEIIRKNLEEKKAWLQKQNIPFVLMIAPNKETIYGEYYSDKYKKIKDETRIDQVVNYLKENSEIDIVDTRKILLEKKNSERLYQKTDTHWNELGAYYGYTELMDHLWKYSNDDNLKAALLEEFNLIKEYKKPGGGDLANMLGVPKSYGEEHIFLKPKEEREAKPVQNEHYDLLRGDILTQPDKSKPRLLMFRDSFAVNLAPFISEHFSEAVYEWSYNFNGILVNQIKPDFVVQEVVEYKLESLLIENQTFVRQMEVEE